MYTHLEAFPECSNLTLSLPDSLALCRAGSCHLLGLVFQFLQSLLYWLQLSLQSLMIQLKLAETHILNAYYAYMYNVVGYIYLCLSSILH